MSRKSYLFILIFSCWIGVVLAQKPTTSYQSQYTIAKQFLQQGKFGLAMENFKQLLAKSESNALVPYANFYLGVAACNNGDISYAKKVFLQLSIKYPQWDKIDAAYLWLCYIGYQQSGAFQALLYASKIVKEPYLSKKDDFLETKLRYEPIEVLSQLYKTYPNQLSVGITYARALSQLPPNPQHAKTLDSLVHVLDLDAQEFSTYPASVVKDTYTIGVLLPLFIDRLVGTGKYIKKNIAIDIYEGALMAINDVDSLLFSVKVLDTKMDSSTLTDSYNNGWFDNVDAVFGAIYTKPMVKMANLSTKNKLLYLNPTSSNSSLVYQYPYLFLSRAGGEQLAKEIGEVGRLSPGAKTALIYYGTSISDSAAAFTYKQQLESDSIQVIEVKKIGKENRREIYDQLTASTKVVDRSKVSHMTKDQLKNTLGLPMRDSLLIAPDSIGQIFIASNDYSLATEAMSAIISRGDTVQIYGVGNWFEAGNANFSIMEGLGVTLAISAVDDVATDFYKKLTNRYMLKFHKKPGKYFFRGYFGMKALAESLKNYGTYFMNGYRIHGNFDPIFDFSGSNSNGAVKVIRIMNHQISEISVEDKLSSNLEND